MEIDSSLAKRRKRENQIFLLRQTRELDHNKRTTKSGSVSKDNDKDNYKDKDNDKDKYI